MKTYLAISGGYHGTDVITRFKAASDGEAFLKATVDEGQGLQELVDLADRGVFNAQELVEQNMGSQFDPEEYSFSQDDADYSDIYIEDMTLLFNVTDNVVVYGEVEDMEFGF